MVVAKMTTSPLIWATDGPVGPQKRGNFGKRVDLEGKVSLVLDMFSLKFSGISK